jgi:hypothetical protein
MQALRWLVAGFIILNAVSGGLLALRAVVIKRRARIDIGMPAVNALLASVPWPLVGLWLASMTLFLASALLLVLVEPAAVAVFVLALALDLAVVWKAHAAIYGRGSGGALLTRCLLFGMLFLAGNGVFRATPAGSPHTGPPSGALDRPEGARA